MVGSVLSNRYELLENIGAGGMAIVYKAKCRLLNRYVAVKILRPEFQEDDEFLKRFTIEAQAAASLSHPNVVSVYDVGRHGKLNYIVMECIEGITLKEYMTKKGNLSINEAVDFTMQIASALEHAHAKGIIHRDIKPHNIIITNEGVLKVTDFGLARAVSKATTVAGSGSAIGSVHYVSPEQARGGFTDERSDIYSLGVVMYEMFAGQLPFDSDTPVAVAMKHLEEEPKKPMEINAQIPEEIEAVILKALAKDVKERYATITALLQDIRKIFGDEEMVSHTDKFSTKKLPNLSEIQKEQDKKEVTKKKKKREDTIAVVAAVATAVVIIVTLSIFAAGKMFPNSGKHANIVVPSLLNMPIKDAREKYPDLLIEEHSTAFSSTIPEGYIITQDKEADSKIKAGDVIGVTVSRGAQIIELDDYTDRDYRVAERELKALELVPQISEEHSDTMRAGAVIRQNPAAGYELKTGSTVILYVSKGKSDVEVEVPSLLGQTEEEARQTLKAHDLKLGEVEETSDNAPKGTVVRQSVSAGTMISTKTAIHIIISRGAEETGAKNGIHSLRLELPKEKESAHVRVTGDGKTLLEGTFETALSPVTLNLTGEIGSTTVDIYIDDMLYKSGVPVTFS